MDVVVDILVPFNVYNYFRLKKVRFLNAIAFFLIIRNALLANLSEFVKLMNKGRQEAIT